MGVNTGNKLSPDLREEIIKEIFKRTLEGNGPLVGSNVIEKFESAIRKGYMGLENMTDVELYEEYKQCLDGYDLLKEIEVELAIDEMLSDRDKL